MNSGRWWLALAYTLATLVASGPHRHSHDPSDDIPVSHGDCDETRPHVAGHEGVALGDAPTTCPSCQFRAQHSLWEQARTPEPGPSLAIPIEVDRAAPLPGSPLRTRCRAPPRV